MFSRTKRMLGVAVLGLASVTLTAVPAHANDPVVVSGAVTEGTPLCALRSWVPLLGNLQPLDEICD
ncbi:hypothetical protein E1292_21265 [Nonomuraea deserti]|uniref:Uncharacterized protein n=1 Tax=Nonomuraea deserti TaxID=1848322 RepID=A0A4R4VD02_9ACTN|nr:hypothetical protein [Nonomuraea deserti]TDD03378.1 hypothetical protein E1292_21265 [Nonomuraea deserti]